MATYGEYKVISDKSAANLQNTTGKSVADNVAKIKSIEEQDRKERRMFDIRQRKRDKEASDNQAAFEAKGKNMAKGINDSFNEEYNALLTEYSKYSNILEDPSSNRKSRRDAMENLAIIDRDILATKANQEAYIGGTAALEKLLSDPAALGSTYGFVNLSMGEGKINKDGGVAQDIANQLIGKGQGTDEFQRFPDGRIKATGTYLNADQKEIPYTTELTAEEAAKFLNNPTYNYIKPTENAVRALDGKFLNETGSILEMYIPTEKRKTVINGSEVEVDVPKREDQNIRTRQVSGDGRTFEVRETVTVIDSALINEKIQAEATKQYNAFFVNPSREAQIKALESIGLKEKDLDLLDDSNNEDAFQTLFNERLIEKIEDGVINTNKRNGEGIFKDENGWYFVEQVSKTEIKKGVSNKYNSSEQ